MAKQFCPWCVHSFENVPGGFVSADASSKGKQNSTDAVFCPKCNQKVKQKRYGR